MRTSWKASGEASLDTFVEINLMDINYVGCHVVETHFQ